LETYIDFAPRGFQSFVKAIPIWLKEKLFLKRTLREELAALSGDNSPAPPLLFARHHQSHAASAFFASPFEKAAVLCLDGVGEWATSSAWLGDGNRLQALWEIRFPHSLGLLYSAFTYYTGFRVNSGEYKLMGLAPYGEPVYAERILSQLMDLKEDGTFRLDMSYFNYATGLTMTSEKFHQLFDGPPRQPESKLTQKEMDLARSIQWVTEEIVLRLARTVHREQGVDYLCLAGGVALNCVANGRLLREGPFRDIWIQPAAGDAGGALGAALAAWHEHLGQPRTAGPGDQMRGSFLGPEYSADAIRQYLHSVNADYEELDSTAIIKRTAAEMASEQVIGWFSGRMEFGPRALGARSILGDARSRKMQSTMNLKIKYRESFRPFAPAVKADKVNEWFQIDRASPYMLLVADVAEEHKIPMSDEQQHLFGMDKLNIVRSSIPAVTHVDYSARVQTVHADTHPALYALLDAFESLTGCPVCINTSFNVRGEPIVMSPEDAYRCFMRTGMDVLVLENFLLYKSRQPAWEKDDSWQDEFELD
ncbi:MAG TPA: carbamoyltransferase N-terminal domain-containing protein, partial [Xanthomonadales bacterium]|nr:carbamoyltransferase N-terminal domain-containing protein [Xanthomonadales bacterium]